MKILLINYRYYEAGGPERYLFNVTELLEAHGHTVIPFSLRYRMNKPSPYEQYFADPPGGDDQNFYYRDLNRRISSIGSLLGRQFYSRGVYNRLRKLIGDTKPDVAYVLHFLRKLSPSVIDACHDAGVPVIVRLSDFALICPKNSFYRDNAVCELCQTNVWNSVKYNCVKDSKTASLVNYLAHQFHYLRGVQNKISEIVAPSSFTIGRFKANKNFSGMRFSHVPTFVNSKVFRLGNTRPPHIQSNVIAYWGRISYEKGIDSLLDAMKQLSNEELPYRLRIIGDGEKEYVETIRRHAEELHLSNVEFIPFLEKNKLFENVLNADAAIVPSVWYDNMPNSLLEAQALGIPVLASNIGSLTEMIRDGYNGRLFKPADSHSIAETIKQFYADPDRCLAMRLNSYQWAIEHYSSETHFEKLMTIFRRHAPAIPA